VKEIKFMYNLLRDILIKAELLIVVKTDNIGAIFMSQNASMVYEPATSTLDIALFETMWKKE
jgi:hypothetical protein